MKVHLLASPGVIACVLCFCLHLAPHSAPAQAPAAPRTYEDILKTLPKQDVLKLRSADKRQIATELTQKLRPEIRQKASFRVKVGKVAAVTPAQDVHGWIITATDEKV